MRQTISIAFSTALLSTLTLFAVAQTTPSKPSSTAKKPTTATQTKAATSAKPATPTEPPTAIFDTSMGQMSCVLFPKEAPKTVANFIGLATGTKQWTDPKTMKITKRPLYDNTIFHRVIPNFMIQGGDPIGNGMGNPGYSFEDEFVDTLRFDRPGRLAMANSGPSTNGSQFFITEVPTPHLDGKHTIFGQCDDHSVELVKSIARVAADPRNNMPDEPITIKHITILGMPKPAHVAPKGPTKKPMQPKTTTTPKKTT